MRKHRVRMLCQAYQHCDEKHLHRYHADLDYCHSNRIALRIDDLQRTGNAIAGAKGKRLTYQRTDEEVISAP